MALEIHLSLANLEFQAYRRGLLVQFDLAILASLEVQAVQNFLNFLYRLVAL